MNMKRLIPCFLLTGTLLLGSCENGLMTDMEGQGAELPDGKYPLDFTAVQTAPDGTPQTRVSDYDENNAHKSKWDGDEVITVQIADGHPGTYMLDGNGKPTAETPCYWQNTQPATINAWYSNITGQNTETNTDKMVSLSGQSNRLAYVLKATASNVDYKSGSIELEFHHQLAKVRVKLEGQQAGKVESVWVNNYTSCTVTNGDVSADNKDKDYIPMRRNDEYYEANLVPMQAITAGDFIRLNDDTKATISNITQLEAGKVYTITIKVEKPTEINLNDCTDTELTVSGKTILKGDNSQKNLRIIVKPDAEVTLQNVNLSPANGSVITCEGNATIVLADGTTNTITADEEFIASGILVGPTGTTTTIKGNGKLVINGVDGATCIGNSYKAFPNCGNIVIDNATIEANIASSEAGVGIGAYSCAKIACACGDITIKGSNVTVTAGYYGVGIGSGTANAGWASCGNITIIGSTVVAKGGHGSGIGTYYGSCGNILIDGGTVTATGGDFFASGIGTSSGYNGNSSCGTITITGNNTTVTAKKGVNKNGDTLFNGLYDIGKGRNTHTCGKITIEAGATVNGTKYTETVEAENGLTI